jgi:hypothetical protein
VISASSERTFLATQSTFVDSTREYCMFQLALRDEYNAICLLWMCVEGWDEVSCCFLLLASPNGAAFLQNESAGTSITRDERHHSLTFTPISLDGDTT